jgi:DNA-binding helix-hairpin-helix protein with protein kinase domain
MVLTGVAIAPALLIAGITLAIQGEKALTQAKGYEANVTKANAEIGLRIELMKRLRRRSDELRAVLDQLDERAKSSLKELSMLDFDPARDLKRVQQTALLMAEIGRALSAPLLGESGTHDSLIIIERNAA